ncbi:MAG: DUF5107 domain-containing protein [Limisphaerales bacterium]
MIRLRETIRTLPFFRPVPLTKLPLIYHREHLFPYTSYGDTETTSTPRDFRMVVLENDSLRVEIAPELGGRVYSLFDKRIGKEILFSNPVVKPTRILPIWAFISGGMEFNFPIAHSPTSIAEVGCASGQAGDYGFIRVGEREARTGMEWVVELGLVADQPVLIQRSAFRNRTGADHPWMSWTITAVRSTEATEFIHPPHRVLVHDDRVVEAEWPGNGLNWDRTHRQMTALFWKPGSARQFGVFHHDLGLGLMHLADPGLLPGKKVWTYGHGKHRCWGQGTTEGGLSYCEIESGPLLDQSEKPMFPNGAERRFEEYWIPVHSREGCDRVEWPGFALPPMDDAWLGYSHSAWQNEWERFRAGEGPIPGSVVATGIDLEAALRRELQAGNVLAAEPLGSWLAFRGRASEAVSVLARATTAEARRIAGLIEWKALKEPARAVAELEAGPLQDPIAVVELDELFAELNQTAKRAAVLARCGDHRLIIERRADLAVATGQPAEALRLLASLTWPREHQRYTRGDLWKRAQAALGRTESPTPESLGEDTLARFGAYWSD